MDNKRLELIFRALGDSNRLSIIDNLAEGEMSAGEILDTLNIVQSTLSHHMKMLCESGIVTARRDGKWTRYSLNEESAEFAAQYLLQFGNADTVFANAAAPDSFEDQTDSSISSVSKEKTDPADAEKKAVETAKRTAGTAKNPVEAAKKAAETVKKPAGTVKKPAEEKKRSEAAVSEKAPAEKADQLPDVQVKPEKKKTSSKSDSSKKDKKKSGDKGKNKGKDKDKGKSKDKGGKNKKK